MAIKVTGPSLPPAPDPQEKGKVPGVKPGAGVVKGARGPAPSGDDIAISPLAKALSALEGMEDVRPGALEAARRLLDEEGNVVDVEALRAGLTRLLRLLEG